jgi:drug/metabolite transporter (DMT)-like permease
MFFVHSERVNGTRAFGIAIGFVGIVVLIGFEPSGGDRAVLGSLAVVGGSLLYAIGALYTARRLEGVSPLGVAFGSMLAAWAFAAPFGIAELPDGELTWSALASTFALGTVATGMAYLLYFALILGAGATRAILVTYLVPALALVYGITLLDEPLTVQALGGLALVLIGVSLGTGVLRSRRAVADAVRA